MPWRVTSRPSWHSFILRPEFVYLKGGLTAPRPALELAWRLEDQGFRMDLDAYQHVVVEPHDRLTDQDRASIARWRHHLGAIVGYQPPEVG